MSVEKQETLIRDKEAPAKNTTTTTTTKTHLILGGSEQMPCFSSKPAKELKGAADERIRD